MLACTMFFYSSFIAGFYVNGTLLVISHYGFSLDFSSESSESVLQGFIFFDKYKSQE